MSTKFIESVLVLNKLLGDCLADDLMEAMQDGIRENAFTEKQVYDLLQAYGFYWHPEAKLWLQPEWPAWFSATVVKAAKAQRKRLQALHKGGCS